jgi:hypothetical protein
MPGAPAGGVAVARRSLDLEDQSNGGFFMAQQLVEFYNYVRREHGKQGAMRLAMMTNVPSILAQQEPDSPENVERFKEAIKQLTGAA